MSRFFNPTSLPPPSVLDQFATRSLFGNPQARRVNPLFAPDSFGGFGALLNTPFAAQGFKAIGLDAANSQFSATQNAFDRFSAMNDAAKVAQVAAMTSRGDARIFANYANTVQQVLYDRQLSQSETDQGRAFGDLAASNATTAMAMLGPMGETLYDQLTGGRSSLMLGQKLQSTFNNAINPLSGTRGYDASYTASVTGALAGRSFETASDRFALRGIRSGDMGNILGYMQNQGQLGLSAGLMSSQERRLAAIGTTFDDSAMRRIVEQTSGVKDLIAAGKIPSKELLAQTQTAVGGTLSQLRTGDISTADLSKMTGGIQILSEIDASRMRDKLQTVAKSVRTMKDIFGDEGQLTAPMQQVLKAIDGLTQGAARVLSPEKVNDMLREMQIVAKRSGTTVSELTRGMQVAMQGLKERGGDASMATPIVTGAYARVAAMTDRQGFENLGFGEDDPSATVARQVAKRVAASTSGYAKQRATVSLMTEQGQIQPKGGSKLEAYRAAENKGVTSFTHGGKTYNTYMSDADFTSMIMEGNDGTISAGTISAIQENPTLVNEQLAKDPNSDRATMRVQDAHAREIMASEMGSGSFSAAGTTQLPEAMRQGIMTKFASSISEFATSPELRNSDTRGAVIRRQMVRETSTALQREQGLPPADADAQADKMIASNLGGLMASSESAAKKAGFTTFQGYARGTDTSTEAQEASNRISRRLEAIDLDLASNQVGEDVLTRIGQAMSEGTLDPNASMLDVAQQMLGGLTEKQKELLSASKMGGTMSAYVDGKQKLEGMRKAAETDSQAAESYAMRGSMLVALAQGGDDAKNFLKSKENSVRDGITRGELETAAGYAVFDGAKPDSQLSPADRLTLAEAERNRPELPGKLDSLRSKDIVLSEYDLLRKRATEGKHLFQEFDELGMAVGDKISRNTMQAMAATSKAIAESTVNMPGTAETQAAMGTYLKDLGATVDSLYGDKTSLKQLGAGAVSSLDAVSKSRQAISDTLEAKKVSLAEYMTSDKLTEDEKANIKTELDNIQKHNASWDEAKGTQARAGFGRNERAAISETELAEAEVRSKAIIAAKAKKDGSDQVGKPNEAVTKPDTLLDKPAQRTLSAIVNPAVKTVAEVIEPILRQLAGSQAVAGIDVAGVGVTPQEAGGNGASTQHLVLSGNLTLKSDGTVDLNATAAKDKAITLNSIGT